MPPERLARWFVREGDTYVVVKELREMCIFSQHNVIKDAPLLQARYRILPQPPDLPDADLQNRVIPCSTSPCCRTATSSSATPRT